MKTSQGLKKIQEELVKSSGYPDHTVEDPIMAFSYGLVIGVVMSMVQEWEHREEERKHAQSKD